MASTSETQDQQFPLAAQIPLESFTLPTFPPAASQLRSLTLTSDINLNDYQQKHLQPGTFEPSTTLPPSITHLTLELFSLGFPAPFLNEIAKRLPNLQSLTLFSCLVDGLSDASRKDALTFFRTVAPTLRELHIVDSFTRVGFWKEAGELFSVSKTTPAESESDAGLKILEVSYTYRGHYESDFLNRTAGDEWSSFISPTLVGLSLNFSPPPEEESEASMQAEKPEDQEDLKAQDGILPFASDGRASLAIRRKFEALSARSLGGGGLKVLNLSMFALTPGEVGEIAYACAAGGGADGLAGLTVSVLLEERWLETLSQGLAHQGAGGSIENLEIVGVPVEGGDELAAEDVEKLLMKSHEGMKALAKSCARVERLEMSILKSRRIGNVVWEKENGAWTMHRNSRTGS